jgi:hypothetical protein
VFVGRSRRAIIETTWMHIGGLAVQSPVTAMTNVLLAVQCALSARSLQHGSTWRARRWSGFFVALGVGTGAGAVTHGFGYAMSDGWLVVALWVSSLAGGVATWAAQRATLATRVISPMEWRVRLQHAATLQLVIFLAANAVLGPRMILLVANIAIGLPLVILLEGTSTRRAEPDGRRVAAGLLVSLGAALVYFARVSPGRWFNHIDLAHVVLGVSLALVFRGLGTRPSREPRSKRPRSSGRPLPVSGSS